MQSILSDNASIHKTFEVKNLLKLNNASLITITAYSPCLNPTEKLIRFIKQKIQAEKNEGRQDYFLLTSIGL